MRSQKQLGFIFLCFCIPHIGHSLDKDFAGPFRVLLHQISQCDDSGTRQIHITSTRISKVSRTKYLFSTNVTTEVPINDDLAGELEVAIFGNGGWRPHYMQLESPHFCIAMRQLIPDYFDSIIRCLGVDCPIPPGNYTCNDLVVKDFKMGPIVPVVPYGKYRADYSAFINGTLLGCIRYYVDVVPDMRARQQKKPRNN